MIRKAEIKDKEEIYLLLKEIALIHKDLYPKHFNNIESKYNIEEVEKLILDKSKLVLVYEQENNILAYLIGFYEEYYFFVDDICVKKEYRGIKIGESLLSKVEELIDVDTIRLNVWYKNIEAIKFYKKLEFETLKYVLEKKK